MVSLGVNLSINSQLSFNGGLRAPIGEVVTFSIMVTRNVASPHAEEWDCTFRSHVFQKPIQINLKLCVRLETLELQK